MTKKGVEQEILVLRTRISALEMIYNKASVVGRRRLQKEIDVLKAELDRLWKEWDVDE